MLQREAPHLLGGEFVLRLGDRPGSVVDGLRHLFEELAATSAVGVTAPQHHHLLLELLHLPPQRLHWHNCTIGHIVIVSNKKNK